MNLVSAAPRATLFWRLAVLRRQLERARADIESLRGACAGGGEEIEDLGAQLSEAAVFLRQAADYLTPEAEHPDLDLQTMRPIIQEARS